MSYDYGSDTKTFEVANPYQLQNRLMFLAAAVLLLAGLYSLWHTRELMQASAGARTIAPLVCSVGLLLGGLWLGARAASRLRFFFGRGRPASLAPDLAPGTYGSSREADAIKETLRHGAITYPEPHGALEGLLYDRVPHLITAPRALQDQAKLHFFNLAALGATFVSFVFAWGIFGDPTSRPWVALLYGVFGAAFLLRPVTGRQQVVIGTARLVGLILAAVLAPVILNVIAPKLPPLGAFSLHIQVFALLLGSLVVVALSMAATVAQVAAPPQTHTSSELDRVSLQAPPAAVIDELDRVLQEQWTERVPNRRYSRMEPQTPLTQKSGSFTGEQMEESQPVPRTGMVVADFAAALGSSMHRWLVASDVFCTALLCFAAALVLVFVHRFDPTSPLVGYSLSQISTAFIFAVVAGFGLRNASLLWGRFDFTSVITWVELQGTYQISRIGTGNQLTSQMQTESEVVRVEAMTLRVWRARLESVVFGKDSARQITALFSTDVEAKALTARLTQFAQSQSVIAAPQATEDQRRLNIIGAGNQALSAALGEHASLGSTPRGLASDPDATLVNPALAAMGLGSGSAVPSVVQAQKFCSACGTKLGLGAKFCQGCGVAQ